MNFDVDDVRATGWTVPIASTRRCIYYDGVHVDGPPDCPHTIDHDELGDKLPTGWTIQQADQAALNRNQSERDRNVS